MTILECKVKTWHSSRCIWHSVRLNMLNLQCLNGKLFSQIYHTTFTVWSIFANHFIKGKVYDKALLLYLKVKFIPFESFALPGFLLCVKWCIWHYLNQFTAFVRNIPSLPQVFQHQVSVSMWPVFVMYTWLNKRFSSQEFKSVWFCR